MADTLLFIDTNILLDFYRAPQSDLSLEVFDLLLNHSKYLIISDQVKLEFQQNRSRTILSYMNQLPKEVKKSAKAPVILSETNEGKAINDCAESLQKKIDGIRNSLQGILDNPEEKDDAYRKIIPLFDINSQFNSGKQNASIIDKIFLKAMMRFHRNMPPRKKDDFSIGDAFNWEWCIYCCSYNRKMHNLIIVSRDYDFADPQDNNRINTILENEFKDRIGKNYTIKLERSLKKSIKEVKLAVSKSMEEELDKVQKSSEELFKHKRGECHLCGAHAMFDVYCSKCGTQCLWDVDGDAYRVDGHKVYELDSACNEHIVQCQNCKCNTMDLDYSDYCSYCSYKLDKAFSDDE